VLCYGVFPLLLVQGLGAAPVAAAYPELRLTAQRVEVGGMSLDGLVASLDDQGRFRVDADRVAQNDGGLALDDVSLEGALRERELGGDAKRLAGEFRSGPFAGTFDVSDTPGEFDIRLTLPGQDLQKLKGQPLLPAEVAWLRNGVADVGLTASIPTEGKPSVSFTIDLHDLSFDSPDGEFAGEALSAGVKGALLPGDDLALKVDGKIRSGELLVYDFYRNFADAGLNFSLRPHWGGEGLLIDGIQLGDGNAFRVEAQARQAPSGGSPWSLQVNHLELNFPGAYHRYLESWLAARALDGLQVTGRVNWDGEWAHGQFRSGDLLLEDISVVDVRRNRFAVTGLDGRMRPGDHAFDSRFTWRGLLLGRINLGSGQVALDSEPGVVALRQPLELQVLGGRFDLREFRLRLPGGQGDAAGDPEIRLQAELRDLDMQQLTTALGWPEFRGRVSGTIPAVRLQQGVLEVDGKIYVNVFDGLVSLQDLRVERLFGVLPSLAANVEVTGLDLAQLTSTFSFGHISGRLDGYVHDLRMLNWQPVAFDGWLGTPADQTGKQDISRKAVTHLTTIGGGSATAALASPLMRMFSSFSYRRLGMGCTLADNVCEIRGLGQDESSVLLLEGAGVPKITIRAFNRRVDWPQMVANLEAVSGEGQVQVGDPQTAP
jgi:hypothetical protein